MSSISCLNCDTEFEGKFCPNCAQRASTQRLDFRRVFSWDFLSDNFNLDRGLLKTAKDLIIRPGHMINDYLGGKRRTYFNFIGFLLITLAIETIMLSVGTHTAADVMFETVADQAEVQFPTVREWMKVGDIEKMMANQKFIFLLIVPIAAFFNWLIFRRMKYNLMEHAVAITFMLAMNTILGLFISLTGLTLIPFDTFKTIYMVFSFVTMALGLRLFWQFSQKAVYSTFGRIWRVLVGYLIVIMLLAFSLQVVIGIFTAQRNIAEKGGGATQEMFEEMNN